MTIYLETTFFALETFNVVAHVAVLTGIRMLPRRVLVKQVYYFIFDLVCCISSFLLHGRCWPIILVQNIQHIYYILTWDSSWATKRVISWSSLDWDRSRWQQVDLVTGTLFDALVHAMNAYFLMGNLDLKLMVCGLAIVAFYTLVVLYNPRLAWGSFKDESTPKWIREKVKELTPDQRNEWKPMEHLGAWLAQIVTLRN